MHIYRMFIPFDKLIKKISFREDGYEMKAIFTDENGEASEIGAIRLLLVKNDTTDESAVNAWKDKVMFHIRASSSTVILRTACMAERTVDLQKPSDLTCYRVPLNMSFTYNIGMLDQFDATSTSKVRIFKWGGRYYKDGTKILDEMLSD